MLGAPMKPNKYRICWKYEWIRENSVCSEYCRSQGIKDESASEDKQIHVSRLSAVRPKNIVMGPAGPEIKNYCADEGQQQITTPDQTRYRMTMGVPHDINFEVFIAATVLIVVVWVEAPCSLVDARHFGGTSSSRNKGLYPHIRFIIRRGPKGKWLLSLSIQQYTVAKTRNKAGITPSNCHMIERLQAFPDCPRPRLPASNSNSYGSQRLNPPVFWRQLLTGPSYNTSARTA
jgi:hypothetical protein